MSKHSVALVPAADVLPGRVVKRTGQTSCAIVTDPTIAGGEVPVGVMEMGGEAGVVGSVTMVGPAKARAGGVITPGTHLALTYDANGKLVPATPGDQVVAIFTGLTAAADGHEIDVFMLSSPGGPTAANVPIVDAAALYTATQVESALAEAMAKLNKIVSGSTTLVAGAKAIAVGAAFDGKPAIACLKTNVAPGTLKADWDGSGNLTITSSAGASTDQVWYQVDGR